MQICMEVGSVVSRLLPVRAALCALKIGHSLWEVIQEDSWALLDKP